MTIYNNVMNIIKVYLKGTEHLFSLYLLEYHSVGYACSIFLLFVFLTQDYVGPLSIFYAALLLLWGLPSINELFPLLLWYMLRQCCCYVVSMFLVSISSVFSTLYCFFLMSASVAIQLMFSDGHQPQTQL